MSQANARKDNTVLCILGGAGAGAICSRSGVIRFSAALAQDGLPFKGCRLNNAPGALQALALATQVATLRVTNEQAEVRVISAPPRVFLRPIDAMR